MQKYGKVSYFDGTVPKRQMPVILDWEG
jgi:hypothetical protein